MACSLMRSPKIFDGDHSQIHQRETSLKRTVHSQCSNRRVLRITHFIPRRQTESEVVSVLPRNAEKVTVARGQGSRKAVPWQKISKGSIVVGLSAESGKGSRRDATTYQRLTRPRPVSNRT